MLHIVQPGLLVHLHDDLTLGIALADHGANLLLEDGDEVNLEVGGLCGLVLGVREHVVGDSDVLRWNVGGEHETLDTTRVVVGVQDESTVGNHLVALVQHRQFVGVLDVGQTVEQKVQSILLGRLILELNLGQGVQVVPVIVGIPEEAGLLARDDTFRHLESLGTQRDDLGILVCVGGHHLEFVGHQQLLEVEGDAGIRIPGEPVEVHILSVAESDNVGYVKVETFSGKNTGLCHEGAEPLIVLVSHNSFLLLFVLVFKGDTGKGVLVEVQHLGEAVAKDLSLGHDSDSASVGAIVADVDFTPGQAGRLLESNIAASGLGHVQFVTLVESTEGVGLDGEGTFLGVVCAKSSGLGQAVASIVQDTEDETLLGNGVIGSFQFDGGGCGGHGLLNLVGVQENSLTTHHRQVNRKGERNLRALGQTDQTDGTTGKFTLFHLDPNRHPFGGILGYDRLEMDVS